MRESGVWLHAVLFAFLVVAFAEQPLVRGEDAFDKEVKAVAEAMVDFLNSEKMKQVAFRKFEGSPEFPGSAGPGIAEVMVSCFKANGVEVVGLSSKADVAVSGKYKIIPTKDGPFRPKLVELAVTFTLQDEFGNPVAKFNGPFEKSGRTVLAKQGVVDIKSADAPQIAKTVAIPVTLNTSAGSPQARHEKDHGALLEAIKNPTANIVNGNEAKRAESPYGVQIMVNGSPKPISDKSGLVFCEMTRGDEFGMLLRNDSDYDAAVEVKLDGINSFHFSHMRSQSDPLIPLYLHYILPKNSRSLVSGWHIDNDSVKKYRITGFEDSAAFLATASSDIGTISVAFSKAWLPGDKVPEGELEVRGDGESADFIGFGSETKIAVKPAPRHMGQVREIISIRYRK